jgi:hypothetical protein
MKWNVQQFTGLGVIAPAKAEADAQFVWAALGEAQALVLQAQDRNPASATGLIQRLEALMVQANAWDSTRAMEETTDAEWDAGLIQLVAKAEQLRVDAAVVLEEQHKKTQFRGALIGASIVAVGAAGLFWALRKRKKR